jgi:glucose-6-phosphate isomerase
VKIEIPDELEKSEKDFPSFTLPDFVKNMNKFLDIAKELKNTIPRLLGSYNHLGIVGIGGSQVQPLIFDPHANVSVTHLEVPDPYILQKVLDKAVSTTRIVYCSRSGTTNEVISFVPFLQRYSSIAVTNGGALFDIATSLNWPIVKVTHDISGRFAIQNELGIVPMIAMGLDPLEFLNGLENGYNLYFKENSLADKAAKCIYNLENSGISKIRVLTSGTYPQGLGILLTQLINESVPKKETDSIDASFHIMPRGAHSDLQRWYGGKKDSFIFSITCSDYTRDIQSSDCSSELISLVPGYKITAGKHLNITSQAVEETFPGFVFRVILEHDTVNETGLCVGFLHALTVRLCQIKSSNPFNQPAVQTYKERAKRIYKNLEDSI